MMRIERLKKASLLEARKSLAQVGYVRTTTALFGDDSSDLGGLSEAFSELPSDPYYSAGDRRRVLSKFDIAVEDSAFVISEPLPQEAYFQDVRYNPAVGGIQRHFEPVPYQYLNSTILQQFACQHLELYPEATTGAIVRLNVHLIRMEAHPGRPCDTSPSGYHKDGEKYIAVYLLGRHNIIGGLNLIADNRKCDLARFVLNEPGEGYVIDDEAVWHALTPISAGEDECSSTRDILLMDFLP
jgi:hypothetical protein